MNPGLGGTRNSAAGLCRLPTLLPMTPARPPRVAFGRVLPPKFGCRFLPTPGPAANDASPAAPGCFRSSTTAKFGCRSLSATNRSAGCSCSLLTRRTMPRIVTHPLKQPFGSRSGRVQCGVVGSTAEPYGAERCEAVRIRDGSTRLRWVHGTKRRAAAGNGRSTT